MRVLHVIPKLVKGGAEQFALNLVHALNREPKVESVLAYWEPIFQFEDAMKSHTRKINLELGLGLGRINKSKLKEWDDLVLEFKPDIIHSHLFQAELVARANSRPGIRYFSSVHDNMHQLDSLWQKGMQKIPAAFWEKHLAHTYYRKSQNRFLAVSKDTQAYLKRVLPADLAKRVDLVYNGVPTSKFKVYQRDFPTHFTAENPLKIINVGSFRSFKGQEKLIVALHSLLSQGCFLELTFLGQGQEMQACISLAESLGISKQVKFKGILHELQPEYAQHHLYVHASSSESFGLVLIEALAAGLPAIALDAGGNREVLSDAVCTRMLPNNSSTDDIANAILEWYAHPAQFKEASERAEILASSFDFSKTLSSILAHYQASLNQSE